MSSKDNFTPDKSADKPTISDKNLDRLIQQETLAQAKFEKYKPIIITSNNQK